MDIIITLPKSIKWTDYEKELKVVEDKSQILNFKVPNIPKCEPGDKCYLCHNGFIIGYMFIYSVQKHGFRCTTTGMWWEGNFIQRTGKFYYLQERIPMKGFQGYRYFNEK